MKTLLKLLGLVALDFVLIGLWVYQIDPNPSASIGILLIVPIVFGVNLIIAAILLFAKQQEYSKVFLLNSIIASVLIFYLFGEGIDRDQNDRLESWEFNKADTTFALIRWKTINEFSITYSLKPGSSWGILDGKCELKNNDWILTADSMEMKISNNDLIGFRTPSDTIKMRKIER